MLIKSHYKDHAPKESFILADKVKTHPKAESFLWNQPLAEELNIKEDIDFFALNTTNDNALYMGYAGHQFGHFNPRLGDGRAILLGEVEDRSHHLQDLHLKGSGITPFSRGGDGLCPLGPAIREYIQSLFFSRVNIPATQSLGVIKTHETVFREEQFPGAIVIRVASSHLRIGSFEYLAHSGNKNALRDLISYALTRHDQDLVNSDLTDDVLFSWWQKVLQRQLNLISHWMAHGFIHGVMNTDNTTISGQTIDFGPCAFLDEYKEEKVFSSIDRHGRYRFNNQFKIILWNLARLGECVIFASSDAEKMGGKIQEELMQTQPQENEYRYKKLSKLTKLSQSDLEQLLKIMQENKDDYQCSLIALREKNNPDTLLFTEMEKELSQATINFIQGLELDYDFLKTTIPLYTPRNHLIEKAIQASYQDNDEPLHQLLKVLNTPYQFQDILEFLKPVRRDEVVFKTFCGT